MRYLHLPIPIHCERENYPVNFFLQKIHFTANILCLIFIALLHFFLYNLLLNSDILQALFTVITIDIEQVFLTSLQ